MLHRYSHRRVELGSGKLQIVSPANQFLLAAGQTNLGAEQVGFDHQSSVEADLAAVHNRFRRRLGLLGNFQLFAGEQHSVVRLYDSKQDLLVCTLELMTGCHVHFLRAIDSVPGSEGVKQVPGAAKPGSEVAIWQRCIQLVQGKVGLAKVLLPQTAAKYIDGVISSSRRFGEGDMWEEERSGCLHIRLRSVRIC